MTQMVGHPGPGRGTGGGETFYEAQRRHRRAGWRFTVVAVVGLVVTSLPVVVVLSPPIAVVVLIVVDVLRVVLPLPDLVGDVVDLFRHVMPGDGFGDPAQPLTVGLVATVAALAVLPGVVVVVWGWTLVRGMLLRVGPEAVVLTVGARPPHADDPEERQLVNLVEETAIAAGIRPPRVRLLVSGEVNAAIVGSSMDDATVVVHRRLLDQLDRRTTGAIVANLVAMAVDGDLRIAHSMAATTQTVDVLAAVLAAPTSPRARRLLRTVLRVARRPVGRDDEVDNELQRDAQVIRDELVAIGNVEDVDPNASGAAGAWQALTLPLLLARTALAVTQLAILSLLLSPVMALLWRRRRLLADATTVELTRDPDALVAALEHLEAHGARVDAGPWSHLFVVGPEVVRDRAQRRYEHRLAVAASSDDRRAARAQLTEDMQPSQTSTAAVRMGAGNDPITFLPPVEKRLQRLVALGATRTSTPYRRPPLHEMSPLGRFAYVLVALSVPLLAAATALMLASTMAMGLLAAALELAILGPLVALVHLAVT